MIASRCVRLRATANAATPAGTSLSGSGSRNLFASYPGDATHSASVSGTYPLAGSVNYESGFSGATGLTLNGGASIQGTALQLTDANLYESRSFFYSTRVPVLNFRTEFTFQLLDANADGFAFVIQSNGPNALGSYGGGLGYSMLPNGPPTGQSIPNSVAIKFDLHNNNGEGNNSIGVYTGGAFPTNPAVDLTSSGINLHSGHVFDAVITYNGSAISLTLTDQTTHAVFTTTANEFPVDILDDVGGDTAYVGFTAGTGSETAVQNILTWSFTSQNPCCSPISVPSFPNGFADSSNLQLNGSSTISGTALQLTDTGSTFEKSSAYFVPVLPILGFTTDFDFQLGPASTENQGGDGITFVLQNEGLNALGSYGAGLGYGLTSPSIPGDEVTTSIAVKFDLHNNAGEGDNSTGIYSDGQPPTVPATNLDTESAIRLHSGHTFHARLHYNGTYFILSLTDLTRFAVFNENFPADITDTVRGVSAIAGFTGGTGASIGQFRILNWTWSTQ